MNTLNIQSTNVYSEDRLSATGKWGIAIALLFVFSIKAEYRFHFGGFLIHPYLLLLPLAVFFTNFKIFIVSKRVLTPLLLFLLIFSIGSLQNLDPLEEIVKVGASVLTFLFFATSVKSEKDFMMISLGFVLCAVVIGYLGFGKSEAGIDHRLSGINALEGIGNKNAQSLFTLPGIFLAVLLIIKYLKRRNYIMLFILGVSLFFVVIGVFLSANRSGWVGLLIIVFSYLIYLRFSIVTLIIFGVLSIFSYIGINRYARDIVEHKINKTVEGYRSDEGRMILINESLKVGLENPLLGVGMDELHKRMDIAVRKPSLRKGTTDTHFLVGYLFGATGIFSVFLFLLFLFRLTERTRVKHWVFKEAMGVGILLTLFVLLFFIRSFFTREILYSPTFIAGLGLLYSYHQHKWQHGIRLYKLVRNE